MSSSRSIYNFDELFEILPKLCLQTYDAVISLKPLVEFESTNMGRKNRGDKASCFVSLAGFDSVKTLLSELESAYQMEDNVMFHYSPEAHNIAIKLLRTSENNDIADLKILME